MPIPTIEFEQVEELGQSVRGAAGFGSSDKLNTPTKAELEKLWDAQKPSDYDKMVAVLSSTEELSAQPEIAPKPSVLEAFQAAANKTMSDSHPKRKGKKNEEK